MSALGEWVESTLGPNGWVIGYPIGVLLAAALLGVASLIKHARRPGYPRRDRADAIAREDA